MRAVVLLVLVLVVGHAIGQAIGRAAEPEYGLAKRPAWINAHLTGFPDPLPPFRVTRAYPRIEHKGLLAVGSFPGQARMWLVTHREGYAGPGLIASFDDDPESNRLEPLLEIPRSSMSGLSSAV